MIDIMAITNFTKEQITEAYKIVAEYLNNGGQLEKISIRALFAEKCGYGVATVDALMRVLDNPDNKKVFLANNPEYSLIFKL